MQLAIDTIDREQRGPKTGYLGKQNYIDIVTPST